MSCGGCVESKSCCCCYYYYYYTLKCLKLLQGEGKSEESGSSGRAREAWTRRDIYIQSDRLPGIVSPRALMSDPLLPVQKGERHTMTIGPKQDKEEMFKFRPLLPPSPLSRLWSSGAVSFCEFLQSPPTTTTTIVSFQ